MAAPTITVREGARALEFTFESMLDYHGGSSPGGVAHAFKVLERALPLLSPDGALQRRELEIDTSFHGPGARDGLELVTRAITGGRFTVDPALERSELGIARERFVFRLRYRERVVTLVLEEGFVTDEFIELTRRPDRTDADERRLTAMKWQMADRVMAADAAEVYAIG